jgi:hypothetical protein
MKLVCPRCGSADVRQVWYNRFENGLIVPVYPTIDDDIWDCAVCGCEFEADLAGLVEPAEPDLRVAGIVREVLMSTSDQIIRADTGGGKTHFLAELLKKI